MLTDKEMFPRYIFRPGKTGLVKSREEYDQALKEGWYDTVGEVPKDAPVVEQSKPPVADLPDYTGETTDEPGDDALPTRAELEAKAAELGLKYNPQLGDKRLAALIQEKLEA